MYILNQAYLSVPIGVKAEVYIGGYGLARGYLNSPDLTAEKFISNPFSKSGERLYKTGDLARYRPNGDIEFLGRIDNQVKLRGYRIELGEIEVQLIKCPGVKEAVVLAREDSPGDKRLVGYLIAESGYALSVNDLRSRLTEVLADYMLPSTFVILSEFPLTLNGKVDRKALPAPENSVVSDQFEIPQNEIEKAIADIWQDVFHIETINRHDSFFELGGHSLLAIEMISRLSDKYQIDIPIIFVFQAVTVKELAEKIEIALWSGENRGKLEITSDIESGEI